MSAIKHETEYPRLLRTSLVIAAIVMSAYVFTTPRIDESIRTLLAMMLFATIGLSATSIWQRWLWPLIAGGFFRAS